MKTHLFLPTVLILATASCASASILFDEQFTTDTADFASTVAAYSPPFTYSGTPTSMSVSGGVLSIEPQAFPDFARFTIGGFTGNIKISVDIGSTDTLFGSFNTGIVVGDNRLLFHPGFPEGAFRVEGPGGYFNEDMGFTPAPDVLHHMTVEIDAATGDFDITVVDGSNAANEYVATFTNPLYAAGDPIGLATDGSQIGFALFGGLTIEDSASVVPEGEALTVWGVLASIGLAAVAVSRQRRGKD